MNVFVLVGLLAALAHPPAQRNRDTFNGRESQLRVRIPRIAGADASTSIDGTLDEAIWARAATLNGFSQFSPVDRIPAADSTEVLLWYSSSALYVGIRAFEAHGRAHATHADRDKIASDDNVQLLLGTFHDQRQAYLFAVNPLGVQMDGTLIESGPAGGGLTPTTSGRGAPDLSQDYVFASKGRVTEYGYEVELRIPFKSLKYQSSDVQAWDINVVREVQHSGFEDSWAPAKRAGASFLGQSGVVEGLAGFDRGLVLDLNPVVTQKATGAPSTDGWRYERARPQFGGNARWGVTNNLTLNATVHPDFAEVESDAGQFVADPRQALYSPEKRPFFLEGLEQFAVPNGLVYTRRIALPRGAVKLTGKAAGTSIGVLSANDDPSLSVDGRTNALYNIVRLQRDVGGQSRVGALYTDREAGGDFNRVASVDGRLVFRDLYTASFQLARSDDRTSETTLSGPLWDAGIARNGKRFGFRYAITGIGEDFRAASGFISRTGVVHSAIDHHASWFGAPGARVETITGDVLIDHTWKYAHFLRRGDAEDKKYHFSSSAGLRGGWSLGAGVYWETFGYDADLYRDYQIERTVGTRVDTVPFVGVGRIPNRDYVATLTTPQWSRFNASLVYVGGQDENFFEWAQANINYVSISINARPTSRLRVDESLTYQDFHRRTDGSLAGRYVIPRLKLEYQLTRAVFLRAVGEYDLTEHDDLRDESRSFFPLVIGGRKALATRAAHVRGDWLFSYLPSPGTVFFLGYGDSGDAVPNPRNRFTYQPVVRTTDYFFVKLSYLFRV